jgi:glucose/arabinose dehydrogenase
VLRPRRRGGAAPSGGGGGGGGAARLGGVGDDAGMDSTTDPRTVAQPSARRRLPRRPAAPEDAARRPASRWPARAVGAGAACTLLLAACGDAGAGAEPATSPTVTAQPAANGTTTSGTAATGTPATNDAQAPGPDAAALAATGTPGAPQVLARGLDVPWGTAFLPDGSALVSLRDAARVVRVAPDGAVTDVPAAGPDGRVPQVVPGGEGGLLGLALSPGFAEDGLVYAYLTAERDNRVLRMRWDGSRLGPPEEVLTGIPRARVHNGGRIAFGPDGFLYVGTGDASEGRAAQDVANLGGKILRVTPDGRPAPGNPFPDSPVWSLGHRNVQGLGWDSGGRMLASEFGQNRFDELNEIRPGANYGWPQVEGSGGAPEFTDPLLTWTPDEASPSGLEVTGDAAYLASLRGRRLWRVPLTSDGVGAPEALLVGEFGRLRHADVAPDGSLWVLTDNAGPRGDAGAGGDVVVRMTFG